MLRLIFALFFPIISPLVAAQNEDPKPIEEIIKEKFPSYVVKDLTKEEEGSRFYEEFFNMLFYLGLIVAFLLIVAWFLRKAHSARISHLNERSDIKILDSRSLTAKTNIYVVSVYDKIITIADSVNGITLLSENSPYLSKKKSPSDSE